MTYSAQGLFLDSNNIALATDLYQLTMMAAYLEAEMEEPAVFELFVRRVPKKRNYLIAAGLEQCVHYLQHLRFDGESIDYLRQHPVFAHASSAFFERLRSYRFSGHLDAVAEGTPIFGNEPILRIEAPLFEAQLVETYLLSVINYQTSIASKAARVKRAAQGRACADFGTRRAHGPQAGVYAARAGYLAGMDATSNVLAGQLCGIPVVGTAAHAFTMACPSEEEAFARYHACFPKHSTLLIDTYDVMRGARRAAAIPGELTGVRLDSGDLGAQAKEVRALLDDLGRGSSTIVASGDLNEYKIEKLLSDGAPIDVFGVGTELVTSKDHPALGGVYKLVVRTEDGREHPTMKLAENKMTYPGRKQIYRIHGENGRDVLNLRDAPPTPDSVPLLERWMTDGALVASLPDLETSRRHCAEAVDQLPERLHSLSPCAEPYVVEIGEALASLVDELSADLGEART